GDVLSIGEAVGALQHVGLWPFMRTEVRAGGGRRGISRGILAALVAIHAERTCSGVVHRRAVGQSDRGQCAQLVCRPGRGGLSMRFMASSAVDRIVTRWKRGNAGCFPDEAVARVASDTTRVGGRIARRYRVHGIAPFRSL